ncbi:MAG: hypothetical protein P1U68_03600 [Verrucomicrobiales bacterium]|nr:hypothetical protein [Verrucomicrobiales bacterium]
MSLGEALFVSSPPPLIDRISSFFQACVACVLILLVGGVAPILVQSYAWIDMAFEAGGIDQLAYAVTDAAPCALCCAASQLQDPSPADQSDFPSPSERLELFLKTLAVNGEAERPAFRNPDDNHSSANLSAYGVRLLRSLDGNGPLTPPPRDLSPS